MIKIPIITPLFEPNAEKEIAKLEQRIVDKKKKLIRRKI